MNLKNVALYAKGHYQKTDDIWADVKCCLRHDNYMPGTNSDVIEILISNIVPLFAERGSIWFARDIISCIHPENTFRIGYVHKKVAQFHFTPEERALLPDYDYYTAVLKYFLSKLIIAGNDKLGGLPQPSAEVLPLVNKNELADLTDNC